MPKVSEVYPRTWLRVSDLEPGRTYKTIIERVEVREVLGRPRIVISVKSRDGLREVYLNRSSAWALQEGLGDDCEKWTGREITFRRARVRGGREAIIVAPASLATAANNSTEGGKDGRN